MPEETKTVEAKLIANTKNFTTIPNSVAEFCIYTYKAEYETYTQVTRAGFFNSAYSFLNKGDIIRVYLFNSKKDLTNYLEYVVMDIDKINKEVTVAIIENVNLEKKIVV